MTAPAGVLRHLRLDLSDAEEAALDDAIVAAGLDYAAWVAAYDPRLGLYDAASESDALAALESLASRVLARTPVRIVQIDLLVPFDAASFDALRTLEPLLTALPGALPSPREWRFFGDDVTRPPHLWASLESPGLHIAGLLDEPSWERWWDAFERATAHLPRRTL
ncbi:MAG: hypothetical protein AB7S26_39680 [Sandaracinaceae bacterium]